MKNLPGNLNSFHNSSDGIIPSLVTIIRIQNEEIEQLKRDVRSVERRLSSDVMTIVIREVLRKLALEDEGQ